MPRRFQSKSTTVMKLFFTLASFKHLWRVRWELWIKVKLSKNLNLDKHVYLSKFLDRFLTTLEKNLEGNGELPCKDESWKLFVLQSYTSVFSNQNYVLICFDHKLHQIFIVFLRATLMKPIHWSNIESCQVSALHVGCKQGIDQQIFNKKSISRKITHNTHRGQYKLERGYVQVWIIAKSWRQSAVDWFLESIQKHKRLQVNHVYKLHYSNIVFLQFAQKNYVQLTSSTVKHF